MSRLHYTHKHDPSELTIAPNELDVWYASDDLCVPLSVRVDKTWVRIIDRVLPLNVASRVPNALEYFSTVTMTLLTHLSHFAIEVLPSDEGLASIVAPLESRPHYYRIWFSDNGRRRIAFYLHPYREPCRRTCCTRSHVACTSTWGSLHCQNCTPYVNVGLPCALASHLCQAVDDAFEPSNEILCVVPTTATTSHTSHTLVLPGRWTGHDVSVSHRIRIYREHAHTPSVAYVPSDLMWVMHLSGPHSTLTAVGEYLRTRYDGSVVKQWIAGVDRRFVWSGSGGDVGTAHVDWHENAHFRSYYYHSIVLDVSIAFAAVDLPIYVLLFIIDWLPGVAQTKQYLKVRLLESVRDSVRAVRERRDSIATDGSEIK